MAAYALHFCLFNPNKRVAILSKGDAEAKEVISRIKIMYEELPFWLRPTTLKNNDHTLSFENGSSIQSKASGKQSGRSISASLLILDEAAFIEFIDTIWAAVGPTTSTGGRVVCLSTVNGTGNWFHKMYTQAIEKSNGFHPIDITWREHPEYKRHDGFEWLYKQMEEYSPPINVDNWESTTRKKHSFKEWEQEYESSFLGTGATYIEGEILRSLKENCNKDYWIKYNNRMRIWEDPLPNHEYVVAADPSIGRDRDYSAFHIIDIYNGKQVAEFYSNRTPINEFARIIADEANLYNTAFVCPERNGIGNNLIYFLKEELEYENLVMDDKREIGILITQKNKENLLADMEHSIRSGRLLINSERLVDELLTFVIDPDTGKVKPDTNCHDDLIMSFATSVHIFNGLRGNAYIERTEEASYTPLSLQNNYTYKVKTSTDELTEENIKWLIGK
tara:strand:+ start:555 stop:1898 length:1344 start_codon:yes stop_codon:yes gene_type:complete